MHGTLEEVQPGDLITADFMNGVIAWLQDLEQRVTMLEQGGSNDGQLQILQLLPSGPFRVGDTMTVIGLNFAEPASLNTVTISGTAVPAANFLSTSNATQLVFVIPPVPGLAPGGSPRTLQVSNVNGLDTHPFTLRPQLVFPSGRIEVAYSAAPVIPIDPETGLPGNITGGNSYVFTFQATAFADREGTYELAASINTGWTAQILEDATDTPRSSNVIVLPGQPQAGEMRTFRVRVTVPNQQAGTAALTFGLTETSEGTQVTPGSDTINLTIGSPAPTPDTRVRVSIRSAALGASIVGSAVQFSRNVQGGISFNILFTVAGAYTVAAEFRNPTGWAAPIVDPSSINISIPTGAGTANQDVNFLTTAGTAAVATDLLLHVTGGPTSEPVDVTYVQRVTVV